MGMAATLCIALVLFTSNASAASFRGLGDLPGGSVFSRALGISEDGRTVVGVSFSDFGDQAFVWDEKSGMRSLAGIDGAPVRGTAYAASRDGSTIVGVTSAGATAWDKAGSAHLLGDLPGGREYSLASDVSADGSVIVGESESTLGREAFIWTADMGMVGLGALTIGEPFSSALAVSADGATVVGGSSFDFNDSLFSTGFTWTAEGGMRAVVDPTGAFYLEGALTDISANGSVAVGSFTEHGFVWDEAHGVHFLSTSELTYAAAVSSDGSTIVGSHRVNETKPFGFFIWDSQYGMRDIQILLKSEGIDLSGWTLTSVQGIASDNRTIIGTGINPDGVEEGWIAIIPEPSTTLLLGLGLAGLAARRHAVYLHGK